MLFHIHEEIEALASCCKILGSNDQSGWAIDSWTLSDEAITHLLLAYRKSLLPDIYTEVLASLVNRGVDVDRVFLQPDKTNDVVTRGDIIELAAAASAVAAEKLPLDQIFLSNSPKRSRRKSDSGLDLFYLSMKEHGSANEWGYDEKIFIYSSKHTTSRVSDLRTHLVDSLSEQTLSVDYLQGELRVLNHHLREGGMSHERADRVYLILSLDPLLNPQIVKLIAVGAVDSRLSNGLKDEMSKLPVSRPGLRRFRSVIVKGLDTLQDNV